MLNVTPVVSEIPRHPTDAGLTGWGARLEDQMFFAIIHGSGSHETYNATDLSGPTKAIMDTYGRGVTVDLGDGNDTVVGSAYGDSIAMGAGTDHLDGGANLGSTPWGGNAVDVLEVYVADLAHAEAITVVTLDATASGADATAHTDGYRFKVVNGSGVAYVRNIEQINVRLVDTREFVKSIALSVNVNEIRTLTSTELANYVHYAWAQGSAQSDVFNATTDISANTRVLMTDHGRGVYVDMGAGDDTVTGSAFGDNINGGSGTNLIDGGANDGTPPWGGKAEDVLQLTVANQAAADAVQVTALSTTSGSAADMQAANDGYAFKVFNAAGAETDYIKNVERVTVLIATGDGGSSFARDIPLAVSIHEADLNTNVSNYYHLAWVNGTERADTVDLSGDSALLSADLKAEMAASKRGVWVDGGSGNDTITGTAYSDNFRNGTGNAKIDGGANDAANGKHGQDVFEIQVASQAEMDAVVVTPSDDINYTWMVTYGSGQVDYLKNIEAISVFVSGGGGKWIPLAVNVGEIQDTGTANLNGSMHYAWASGTAQGDSFNAATDISSATQALMSSHGRGVYVDLGAGNDTVTGSAYGDNINAGSGTNLVDGGANGGIPPWGGKAEDVLQLTVANQAAADAVQVTALSTTSGSAADMQAAADGYAFKVFNAAGAETDYIKNVERVTVLIATGNGGSSFARDIALAVSIREADLTTNVSNNYHLAWVNGTERTDTVDLSGDSALLSAALKTEMAASKRGVWVDGGSGDDIITGTAYSDNFRNGTGNAKIDGGANDAANGKHGQDVFEIQVASQAEMDAVVVTQSDDINYTWKVSYGSGQVDYLKNIEAITINVNGGAGKWIPLAVNVVEIQDTSTASLNGSMHYAWASGTAQDDTFNAATDVSAATRALMDSHQRGVFVDTGAGNDSVTGSAYGDNFNAGSGTNFVDGGTNVGAAPWGGKAEDVLQVTVANQAAADAVQVVALTTTSGSADDMLAATNGYAYKIINGASETDYIKNVERVSVMIANGTGGSTFARDIALQVNVREADLSTDISNNYHLAWVNGTERADTVDLSGDSALLSAALKAEMAASKRGVWVDGGTGNDTITGTAYSDNFRNGAGNAKIDGGANDAANGKHGQDVFEIQVASQAEMDAIVVAPAEVGTNYTWKVTYGSGQVDYLKNIEAITININGGAGKWIPLAVNVGEIQDTSTASLETSMHYAWASGSAQGDSFNAVTDISSATRALMDSHQRGVYVDLGVGDDTVVGSGYGDNISVGSGTNFVDGGANAGSPPWGGKAEDALQITVANQAAADAVQVLKLDASTGSDADKAAFNAGYAFKVNGGSEVDYIKNVERVTVLIATSNGGATFGRNIALEVNVREVNLSDVGAAGSAQLAFVTGTDRVDTIDVSGDSALLSAAVKAEMQTSKRGVWIDGGKGDDTITGSAFGDTIRNGSGNAHIDGGANDAAAGHRATDVFEIAVTSLAELNAVLIANSDDPAYTWMVSYGTGQKDYLKNVEAVSITLNGGPGKWIPLVASVSETVPNDADPMNYASIFGTAQRDSINAATDISVEVQALMAAHGRGVYIDAGAGDDTVTGSGFGDNIVAGSGINYVDGGANAGSPPGGGKALDVLEVFAPTLAAANLVTATSLTGTLTGADAAARDLGYQFKIVNGDEVDYVKDIESVRVQVWNDKDNDGQRHYAVSTDATNEVTFVKTLSLQTNSAPSFSGVAAPGVAVLPAGVDYSQVAGTLLADGKFLASGRLRTDGFDGDWVLTRVNADGTPDTSFGNGSGHVSVDSSSGYAIDAPQVQADGKIVLALTSIGDFNASAADFRVIRMNADGSADTSFGTNGAVVLPVGPGRDRPNALQIQDDGKILVAGAVSNGSNRDFGLVRLNTDGTLDTSFNGSGKLLVPVTAGNDFAYGMLLQADGKIVVVGSSYPGADADFSAIRLNANGTLDTSFGVGGKQVVSFGGEDTAYKVSLLADGKLLLAGVSSDGTDSHIALLRLNADGSVDTSFGGSTGAGKVVLAQLAYSINAMQVQADGKILLGGTLISGNSGAESVFSVTRLNADGSTDVNFGDHGLATLPLHGIGDAVGSIMLLANGKIALIGSTGDNADDLVHGLGSSSLVVAQLNADGSPDASFVAHPASSLGGTVVQATGMTPVVLDQNAAIYDAELAARGNYGGATLTLARHAGASAEDLFTASGEVRFTDGALVVGGLVIGTVSVSGGTLTLAFNDHATQGQVNRAMHGIAYANNSATPPASVTLDWNFSDGNSGAQGAGGALGAQGSTTVAIGVVVEQVRAQSWDATRNAEGTLLGQLVYFAGIEGTARNDTVDASTLVSSTTAGLMSQYGRGAVLVTGAGDDIATGTAYGDLITLGSGTNRADGGANGGTSPFANFKPVDIVQVMVDTQAQANAVVVTGLDAQSAGADAAAFAAGYTRKLVSGAETDYLKNIETVYVRLNTGNQFVKSIPLVLSVSETQPLATDPTHVNGGGLLSDQMYLASAYGTAWNDTFNAGTDISVAGKALMEAQQRGVYVDGGAGDDRITGSAFGDYIQPGSGTNYVDGGANLGHQPNSSVKALDVLELYLPSQAAAAATSAVLLDGSGSAADNAAFSAGYVYKVAGGDSINYVKNIEQVNILVWNDINADGMRGNGEVTFDRIISLGMRVDEITVSTTNPGHTPDGAALADLGTFAWATGSLGADSFDATQDVSAATRALMDTYSHGISADMGAGDDSVLGSAYGDDIQLGAGTNRVDGGANGGASTNGIAPMDRLTVYVADQAASDAVTVSALSAASTGADAAAFASGFQVKLVAGNEIDYMKNMETVNVFKWNDANHDGRRDNGEVSFGKMIPLATRVDETQIDPAHPDQNTYGQKLADLGWLVTASGGIEADHFNARTDISGPTQAAMLQYGLGVYADLGDGDSTIIGSDLSDRIVVGHGINHIDGGADHSQRQMRAGDLLEVYAPSQAAAAAVAAVALTGSLSGADAAAQADGYRYKIVNGTDISYVKNIEQVNVYAWDDKNANGQRDFANPGDPANEVTLDHVITLATNSAPTFVTSGGNGINILAEGASSAAKGSLVLANGKILLSGFVSLSGNPADQVWALTSINADGTLDTSFGNGNGYVVVDHSGGYASTDPVLQADGKVVLALTSVSDFNAPASDFRLVRVNADGSPDTGFGADGAVVLAVGPGRDRPNGLAIDADGKIVVAGTVADGSASNSRDFGLLRLNSDGTLDTSFNGTGKLLVAVTPALDIANSLILQADGKLVVAGSSWNGANDDFSLSRLNPNGSLDTSFGNGGKVIVPIGSGNDAAMRVLQQTDGKLLVAGTASNGVNDDMAVVRLNADGSLDASFGAGGKLMVDLGGADDQTLGATMQGDKIVLVGTTGGNALDATVAVLRLNADGTRDTTFGDHGVASIALHGYQDLAYSVSVVGDKIVLAGLTIDDLADHSSAFVARLNADGSLDTSFNANPGGSVGGTVVHTLGTAPVVLDVHAAVYDAQLAARGSYEGAYLQLQRHDGAVASDVFSASGAVDFAGGVAHVNGVAIGNVTSGNGVIGINFGVDATQLRVDQLLRGISYANTGNAPASAVIDWFFSDGNYNQQGEGFSLSATGSTAVLTGNQGTDGADLFYLGAGNETLDGVSGNDTAAVFWNPVAINGPAKLSYSSVTGGASTVITVSQTQQNVTTALLTLTHVGSGTDWTVQTASVAADALIGPGGAPLGIDHISNIESFAIYLQAPVGITTGDVTTTTALGISLVGIPLPN